MALPDRVQLLRWPIQAGNARPGARDDRTQARGNRTGSTVASGPIEFVSRPGEPRFDKEPALVEVPRPKKAHTSLG